MSKTLGTKFLEQIGFENKSNKSSVSQINNTDQQLDNILGKGLENLSSDELKLASKLKTDSFSKSLGLSNSSTSLAESTLGSLGNLGFNDVGTTLNKTVQGITNFTSNSKSFNDLQSVISNSSNSILNKNTTQSLSNLFNQAISGASTISKDPLETIQKQLNGAGIGDLKSTFSNLSTQSSTLYNNLNKSGLSSIANKIDSIGIGNLKDKFNNLGLDNIKGKINGLSLDKAISNLSGNKLTDIKNTLGNLGLKDELAKFTALDKNGLIKDLKDTNLNNIQTKIKALDLNGLESKLASNFSNSEDAKKLLGNLKNLGLNNLDKNIENLGFKDISKSLNNLGVKDIQGKFGSIKNNISSLISNDVNSQIKNLGLGNVQEKINKLGNVKSLTDNVSDRLNQAGLGKVTDLISGNDPTKTTQNLLGADIQYMDGLKNPSNLLNNNKSSVDQRLNLVSNSSATSTLDNTSKENKVDNLKHIVDANYYKNDKQKQFYVGLNLGTQNPNKEKAITDYLMWQQQVVEENKGRTNDLVGTWDPRLAHAYTHSESIGNSMPYGPEWVGMPSIMNPNALIRFDHIAGHQQHKLVLDQEGTPGFQSGSPAVKYMNVKDIDASTVTLSKGTDTLSTVQNVKKINDFKEKYKLQNVLSINVEEGGQISYLEEDPNRIEYNGNDGAKVIYDKLVDGTFPPSTKEYWFKKEGYTECKLEKGTVSTNNTGSSGLTGSSGSSGSSGIVGSSGITPTKPSNELEGQMIFVPNKFCNNGKVDVSIVQSEEDKKDFINSTSKKFQDDLKKRVIKNWSGTENGTITQWKEGSPVRETKFLINNESQTVDDFKLLEPTYINLCDPDNWSSREQFLYEWPDFLYCKYYGLIPNNHLITLRRFPMPVVDNARTPGQDSTRKHLLPIAKAVTWANDLIGNKFSELLSFSYKYNWGEATADVQPVQGNEKGIDEGLGEGKLGGMQKFLLQSKTIMEGGEGWSRIAGWDEERSKFDPYEGGAYANKVYGGVNMITKTLKRERGLEFSHDSLTLKFVYTLKGVGGINGKAAMLDILANILALTYNDAPFWGGTIRYFPNKPAYPFPGGKKGMDSWYNGNVTGSIDAIGDEISSVLGSLGDSLLELMSNPMAAIQKLASGGAKLWMGKKMKANSRPEILKFKAILTGEPVGEWHLVIGNPFNPIMMIGNLVVDNTKISFSDRLGAEDFPDEMYVEITLKHGKPRDKSDIESMFNRGGGKLHYAYYGQQEAWNNASSTKNSLIDRPAGVNDIQVNGGGKFTGFAHSFSFTGDIREGGHSGKEADHTSSIAKQARKIYGKGSEKAFNLANKMGFQSGVK